MESAIAELQDPTDDVDTEIQDREESAEEEDPERDAVQERAAEVTMDSTCTAQTDPQITNTDTTLFAPPMPKLEFTVIRNLFRGTRHWCVKGAHVICQERLCSGYDRNKYETAVSHDDPFCLDCLRAAEEEYDIPSPERFAHGETQPNHHATSDGAANDVKSDRKPFLNRLAKIKKPA